MQTRSKYIVSITAVVFIVVIILFVVLHHACPLKLDIPHSTIITDQQGKMLHAYLSADEKWRMKTDLHEISPTLKKAIIHKEDKYFYYHFGINPFAIVRALGNNLIKGKRTSGASTITMQVARLLNPKERTYRNKIIEMFRALQLELGFSKDEILQLYLNLVPYGGNIEGVKAAAHIYCNKAPNHLSLAEITILSIIPNRPTSLQPGKNDDFLIKERDKWLRRFKADHLFDEDFIQDAIDEGFLAQRFPIPRHAPHFSRKLNAENNKTSQQKPYITSNKAAHIKSTLDLQVQLPVEDIVQNYTRRLNSYHIHNTAVLVIDNATAEVRAYVGSSNFYNDNDGGQVDGVQAIRSPGSTLKPLIYAQGFDAGLISPKLKIADLPVDFSGYSPTNYSDTYNGMVTVEQALQQSLNIPAVKVLNNIGIPTLMEQFKAMHFQQLLKDEKKLGLSLALGGCGVSLFELTAMYTAFANQGIYRPLQYMQSADKELFDYEMVSPSAAFLITEILTDLNRPDFSNNLGNIANLPKIAWKTGTSYGRKDAWSIGYNKAYTVGVWVGNFSAKGVPELTGADMATPLLFSVFKQIAKRNDEWNFPTAELKHTWVCSETGLLPAATCDHQILDFHLPLITQHRVCNHLIDVAVNHQEDLSYCKHCLPKAAQFKTKTYQNYSPEQLAFHENSSQPYDKIPLHNPQCERFYADEQLKIVSPKANINYYFLKDDNEEILLESHLAADVQQVYWYINDAYYTAAKRDKPTFFKPIAGKNKITCVDDKGRKSSLFIEVSYL